MKIIKRIKSGLYKGYTIRKSINGVFDIYSAKGISQTKGFNSLRELLSIINRQSL